MQDCHYNIRKLISNTESLTYDYSAFGKELSLEFPLFNPYRYASKRVDLETGLVYFGQRYYDPDLIQWLSVDPQGFTDSMNLYQYLLNNPFKFHDPNGESLFGFMLGVGEMILGGALIVSGAALEVATFGGYTFFLGAHEAAGLALLGHGCSYAIYHSQDLSLPTFDVGELFDYDVSIWKNTDVYAPDRGLPKDENGIPIPETDAPHTEIGKRKGKYPQAREFDDKGIPVRDIDFTDHNMPDIHPNPHQHKWIKNPTGGSRIRDNPQPLPEWNY